MNYSQLSAFLVCEWFFDENVSLCVHIFVAKLDHSRCRRRKPPSVGFNLVHNNFCLNQKEMICIPPFKKFDSKFRTSNRYNLTACVIEKSMSTVLAATMCYLHNETAFTAANRTLTTDMYENRFCKDDNEYKSIKTILSQMKTKMENMTLFTMVRNPVERFLSGFVDKCILEKKRNLDPAKCYGCGKNVTCFLFEQYRRAKDFVLGRSNGWSYEDIHFYPQNWHCEMHTYFQNFKIIQYRNVSDPHYSIMVDEIRDVLSSAHVPRSSLKAITAELNAMKKTKHATSQSVERIHYESQLLSDKAAMDLLIKLYYYDFILFGFPLPVVAA